MRVDSSVEMGHEEGGVIAGADEGAGVDVLEAEVKTKGLVVFEGVGCNEGFYAEFGAGGLEVLADGDDVATGVF